MTTNAKMMDATSSAKSLCRSVHAGRVPTPKHVRSSDASIIGANLSTKDGVRFRLEGVSMVSEAELAVSYLNVHALIVVKSILLTAERTASEIF